MRRGADYFKKKYSECFDRLVKALKENEVEVARELALLCAELKRMYEKAEKIEKTLEEWDVFTDW